MTNPFHLLGSFALAAVRRPAVAIVPLAALAVGLIAVPGESPQSLSSPPDPHLSTTRKPSSLLAEAPPLPPRVRSLPEDAVAAVLADVQTIPKADRPFQWWFWVPSEDWADFQGLAYDLFHVSRSAANPQPLRRGPFLARIDLRWYWPRARDLADVLAIRERFANDPSFSLLLTQDTIEFLSEAEKLAIRIPQLRPVDGARTDVIFTPLSKMKDVVVARSNPPRLDRAGLAFLQLEIGTLAPIVEVNYFGNRATSQIQDKNGDKETPFSLIYGGQYYALRGIRKATKDFATDLDQFLFDFAGIQDKGGFKAVFERLRTDQKAALWRSDVTGKKRVIVVLPQLGVGPGTAVPVLIFTEDPEDADIDRSGNPFRDPFNFKVKAYELILVGANGAHVFVLFDAAGKLLDEAAPQVVADRRTPAPGTTRLQPAISCIRCHGVNDGWIPFKNDLNVNNFLHLEPERIDRLQGQYSWDPTILLSRSRDDYAAASLRATLLPLSGGWKGDQGQTRTVQLGSAKLADMWAEERAAMVDAAAAIKRLGFPPAPAGKEAAVLGSLVPSIRLGAVEAEDEVLKAIKEGKRVPQTDFALIYSFVLERLPPPAQGR